MLLNHRPEKTKKLAEQDKPQRGIPRFLDSLYLTLCNLQLLNHTTIVAIYRQSSGGGVLVQELAFSSQRMMWGYTLPECISCGNTLVRADTNRQAARKEKTRDNRNSLVTLHCFGCGHRTLGNGIRRPDNVESISGYDLPLDTFFWKPLPSVSPWIGHIWKDPHISAENAFTEPLDN